MAGAAGNIYAFFGNDEAEVKEAALKLSQKIAPKEDEFGLEVVEGTSENVDHAAQICSETIQAIQTLPFFGGEKVVWLQGANFFGDSVTGRSETTLSAVTALLELIEAGLPDDVKLIISATEIDKRRTFYKKISKLAEVKTFDKVDVSKVGWEMQVMAVASKKAKALNVEFESGALERLVMKTGADTRVLNSELEKLSLYAVDRPVTEEDVRYMAAQSHAGVIFEIGDALVKKNLPLTLDLIDMQMRRGESPVGILLAAIVPKMRSLLHVTELSERHGIRPKGPKSYKQYESAVNALPASETAHLPRKKDGNISAYPLFLAAQSGSRFTTEEVKNGLDACLEANLRLVTSQLDPQLVLNQLVTRILQPA